MCEGDHVLRRSLLKIQDAVHPSVMGWGIAQELIALPPVHSHLSTEDTSRSHHIYYPQRIVAGD